MQQQHRWISFFIWFQLDSFYWFYMGSLALDTESEPPISPELYITLGLKESGKGVCEFPRVLSLLSSILERIAEKNDRSLDSETKEVITIFHGFRAPNISIKNYMERIFKYSKCSPSCFILAHVYIDRFLQRPGFHLTSFNVHRLIMTSVVIAAKFIDDAFFKNAYYARVAGISTEEMNRLELNLLFSLDFRLQVNMGTFGIYCLRLQKEAAECHIERPIQVRGQIDWSNKIEESKCRSALQSCSCGAV